MSLAVDIRSQFEKTRSFAVVSFTDLVKPDASAELFESILANRLEIFQSEQHVDTTNFKGDGIINDLHSLDPKQRRRIQSLIRNFDRAIARALPEIVHDLKSKSSQLRWAHDDVIGMVVDSWHTDGEPLVLIYVFEGDGPDLYHPRDQNYRSLPARDVAAQSTVSAGQVIIFAGLQSVAKGLIPLIHRSPKINRSRMILVRRYRYS